MPRFGLASLVVVVFVLTSRADPIITVYPTIALNVFSSPNEPTYFSNAMSGIQNGGAATGAPGTPGYYASLPNGSVIPVSSMIATEFNSWMGGLNPSAPFNNEFGNRIHFGMSAISAPGSREISLSMVEAELLATGSAGSSLDIPRDFIGGDYAPDFIGIRRDAGGNIVEILDAGQAGTELVDELYFFGYGNAFEALMSDFPGGLTAAAFAAFIANQSDQSFTFTGNYYIGNSQGGGSINVDPVALNIPLPASVWIFVGGIVTLAARRRLTKKAA